MEKVREDMQYPVLQYSFFLGKDQVVIRAGSTEEFASILAELTDSIEGQPSLISGLLDDIKALKIAGVLAFPEEKPTSAAPAKGEYRGRGNGDSSSGLTCKECGSPAEARSGVSAKTGKPWSGTFCKGNKDHVVWNR